MNVPVTTWIDGSLFTCVNDGQEPRLLGSEVAHGNRRSPVCGQQSPCLFS